MRKLKYCNDSVVRILPNCELRREKEKPSAIKRFIDWVRDMQLNWDEIEKSRQVPEDAKGDLANTFRKLNEAS